MEEKKTEEVKTEEKMKLQLFSSKGCGPCRQQKKLLPEIQKQFPDLEIEILDVDDEENLVLCQKYNVEMIPTLVFTWGKRRKKATGMHSVEDIKVVVNKLQEKVTNND